MSEDDDDRVEYRLSTTGKLVNATPERIEELLRLRDMREKINRPRPVVGFETVLANTQGEGKLDPEAESLALSQARRERAQAMARAGLQPTKGDSSDKAARKARTKSNAPPRADATQDRVRAPGEARGSAARFVPMGPRASADKTNASLNQGALPAAPPPREATVIRSAPVPASEPKKGPPPKAPPRAGSSRRTIIKG